MPPPGTTKPGTKLGATRTPTARARRISVVDQTATRRHGTTFSTVIRAATTAIQKMLITPSANRAAISAQQQPRHHAACLEPIENAPPTPSRQVPRRKPNGLRHLLRQTFFSG